MISTPSRNRIAVQIGLILGIVAAEACSTPRPYTGGQGGSNAGATGGSANPGGHAGSSVGAQGSGGAPADAAMPDVPASSGGSSHDVALGGTLGTNDGVGGYDASGGIVGSGGMSSLGGHAGSAGAGIPSGSGGASTQPGTGGSSAATGGASPGTGGTRGSGGIPGSGGLAGSGGASGCQAGGACQPTNPCQKGVYSCATGTQVCVPNGNQPTTVTCGSAQTCTGSTKFLQQMCDGNGACAPHVTQMCPSNETCAGDNCACNSPNQICNGSCVNVQSDPYNCGSCGNNDCANHSMECSAGQCVCGANTPNGSEICFRPGQVRGTCWSGACVLPALGVGCNTASDCVPGGCSTPGGFCLGTIEVSGQVSCGDVLGPSVTCPVSSGCTNVGGRLPPFAVCGAPTGTGTGSVTCDGPIDCPTNYDCCYTNDSQYTSQHCVAQPQPGVIGSGCTAYQPNPNGPQASLLCDPLNPTTSSPPGKSCRTESNDSLVYSFYCQ